MEKLIEVLTSNIFGIICSLIVILGFVAPGAMFIFIWNKELFKKMTMGKLVILSFGITNLAFIPNAMIGIMFWTYDKVYETNSLIINTIAYFILALIFALLEILSCIFLQIVCEDKAKQIKTCVKTYGIATVVCIILFFIIKVFFYT